MKLLISEDLNLNKEQVETLVGATPYNIEKVASSLGLKATMDDQYEWSIDGDEVGDSYKEIDEYDVYPYEVVEVHGLGGEEFNKRVSTKEEAIELAKEWYSNFTSFEKKHGYYIEVRYDFFWEDRENGIYSSYDLVEFDNENI